MGTAYKGDADHYHNISENIEDMKKEFPYHKGLFGDKGESKSNSIRNISSANPKETAQEFYDKLAYGGIEKTLYNKDGTEKGKQVTMADGTIVTWRPISSSKDKSPAVDIDIQFSKDHGDLAKQKIHFVKEK